MSDTKEIVAATLAAGILSTFSFDDAKPEKNADFAASIYRMCLDALERDAAKK